MSAADKDLLRRAHRHLVALGENDRDAGYRDGSLVALFHAWHEAGAYGGKKLRQLADAIDDAEFKPPRRRGKVEGS